jgi:hypothetical protein
MFHRSEKAIRYAKELDEARLNGNFHLVPNLARKLQKHDNQRQCIIHPASKRTRAYVLGVAKSAVCEKSLYDLVAPLEKNQLDLALEKDGPNELVLPPEIRPEKMQDIVNAMEEALKAPGTDEDKQVLCQLLPMVDIVAGQSHPQSNVDHDGPMEESR